MAQWRAVIAVPMIVELEFARDVATALNGVRVAMGRHRPVRLTKDEPDDNENFFEPRILALLGPKQIMDEYAKTMEEMLKNKPPQAEAPSDTDPDPTPGPRAA